jgi:DNA-directed RNA polymerase III subunit RPC5
MADGMDVDGGGADWDAGAGGDDDDEEDPVVKTLDVFLSQNLPGVRDSAGRSDGLLLFQYPLRPKWRPLNDGWKLDKVLYRPLNEMVELELLAGEEGDEFRHRLVSSKVEPKTSFAVGLLRGDQLHLTSLQSMLQFRPRFDWKDEEDAAHRKANASGASAVKAEDVAMDEVGSGSDGEAPAAPVVQVKVSKRESDKAKEIRRSSHAYLREQEEKEAWIQVQLHGPSSGESQQVLESMISSSGRDINFSVTCAEYLNSLDATSRGRAGPRDLVAPQATGQLSREELLRMPLCDQVRSLMIAAKVLPLERLEELLSAVPQVAGGGANTKQRCVFCVYVCV